MDENKKFKTMYNRLDNYLKSLLRVGDDVNLIWCFEQILPEKKQSELKSIRKFKNLVESHGVTVRGATPVAPKEYTTWLENSLNWCKSNEKYVVRKMQEHLPSKYKNKYRNKTKTNNNTNNNFNQTSTNSYNDYFRKLYGYDRSYDYPLTGFAKEVESELKRLRKFKNNSYNDIVYAAVNVVKGYSEYDVILIASEYGYRKPTGIFAKKMSTNNLRIFVAEKMVADLSKKEIMKLINIL